MDEKYITSRNRIVHTTSSLNIATEGPCDTISPALVDRFTASISTFMGFMPEELYLNEVAANTLFGNSILYREKLESGEKEFKWQGLNIVVTDDPEKSETLENCVKIRFEKTRKTYEKFIYGFVGV
jgi:hypothetical protein